MNTHAALSPSLVAAAILGSVTGSTLAADVPPQKPTYKALLAAKAFNPWIIRLRALDVVTRNSPA